VARSLRLCVWPMMGRAKLSRESESNATIENNAETILVVDEKK